MTDTNLKEVRNIGKILFDAVELKDVGYGIVQHPYLSTLTDFDVESKEILDLREEENFKKCRDKYIKLIDESDLLRCYMLIRTPWKLTWFKYVNEYLSEEDFGHFLEDCWISEENPNMDCNVSVRESIKYFKKAKKEFLMVEEDYKYFKNLPEELTVWRGVSPGRVKLGLSWTDNKEKASWFMNRFGEGFLLEAKVNKKDVLAYFNTRDEKELVIDVFKIKNNIRVIQGIES